MLIFTTGHQKNNMNKKFLSSWNTVENPVKSVHLQNNERHGKNDTTVTSHARQAKYAKYFAKYFVGIMQARSMETSTQELNQAW